MNLSRSLLLAASRNGFLSRSLPRRAFVQRAVRRFMPGDSAAAALDAAAVLAPRGIGTVLTELGEQISSREEAAAERDRYLALYDQVKDRGLPSEISVKLTHLGLDLDRAACESACDELAGKAADCGTWLWVDMEESPYVDSTLALYRRLRERHANVGVCLQAYLHRTPTDLEALAPLAPAIRLVKGAYAEPAAVAYPLKRDTDEAYYRLAARMLDLQERGLRPVFGTHDSALIGRIRARAGELGRAPKSVEFHLLYGIRTDIQDQLAREGAGIRVLISFGQAWFAWYMRRLAERPANIWFVLKNLV